MVFFYCPCTFDCKICAKQGTMELCSFIILHLISLFRNKQYRAQRKFILFNNVQEYKFVNFSSKEDIYESWIKDNTV